MVRFVDESELEGYTKAEQPRSRLAEQTLTHDRGATRLLIGICFFGQHMYLTLRG